MIKLKLTIFTLIILLSISEFIAEEIKELCYECRVQNNCVICNCNSMELDIKQEMTRISQNLTDTGISNKHFECLNIANAVIEEFPENSLIDLSFDYVFIVNAINLTRIHSNAFNSTSSQTKGFYLTGDRITLGNDSPDYDFWRALSSLETAYYISLTLGNLGTVHEIPDHAFNAINGKSQTNLNQINFLKSEFNGFNISRIGDYAFYDLPNLTQWIDMSGIPIGYISAHAFDFQHTNDDYWLRIDLSNCQLNESSFEMGIFRNSSRALLLILAYNNIRYFDENIFRNFFDANQNNALTLRNNPLNCDDFSRFEWLLSNKSSFIGRLQEPYCENGLLLWDFEPQNNGTTDNTMPTTNATLNPTETPTISSSTTIDTTTPDKGNSLTSLSTSIWITISVLKIAMFYY